MKTNYVNSRTKKLVILTASTIIIVFVVIYAFSVAGNSSAWYVLTKVRIGTISQTIGTTGLLEPTTELGLNFGVSGLVQSVNVKPNQNVIKGQILATLNTNLLQNALIQAQTNLSAAQAKLTLDETGATPTQLQQGNSQIASAQLALTNATISAQNVSQILYIDQANLVTAQSQITSGPATNLYVPPYAASMTNTTQVQQILFDDEGIVNLDQQGLSYFQQLLDRYQSNEQNDCGSTAGSSTTSTACLQDKSGAALAQSQLTINTQALSQAQSSFAAANQSITALEQLNTAQLNLSNANNAQSVLLAPANANQINIDNSAVQAAQSQLQTAQFNLTQAELIAPFNGLIGQVNISVGQQATPNSSGSGGASAANSNPNSSGSGGVVGAIMLIDPSTFQSVASVSDAQISQIKLGNKVLILPSGLSKPLSGIVTQITPVGTLSQGVIAFPVTTTVNDPRGGDLFTGESAQITFIVNQVSNAIVIPISAVHTKGSRNYVYIDNSGHKKKQKVTTGASNSTSIQIIQGLSPGDQVIIADTKIPLPSGNSGITGGKKGKGGGFLGGNGKGKTKGL